MISRRIDRKPENDSYGKLADYVRDAKHAQQNVNQSSIPIQDGKKKNISFTWDTVDSEDYTELAEYVNEIEKKHNHERLASYIEDSVHKGEKVLYAWHAGCISEDYDLAIKEVKATQALNTRSKKEKTYHLIISFRPEDEEKLTQEVFQELEQSFAKALGFEEHQRHCGVHKNTDNLHIHVAYNMIHPSKLTRHEPYRDYITRDRLCRIIEKKYDLFVDNGRKETNTRKRDNSRAQALEAQTGCESFLSYAQRHKENWMDAVSQASSWREFHEALAVYGVVYKQRRGGAIIKDCHSKASCRAREAARGLSWGTLVKRFGTFEPAITPLPLENPTLRYRKRPLKQNEEKSAL